MEISTNHLFGILLFAYLSEFKVLSQYVRIAQTNAFFEAGPPLFVTPFIENGNVVEAKKKARVQHSDMKDVESYAGFFTVNKEFNSNLFFWYFSSKENPSTDPLILWLQGGPGYTSSFGLFTGNGPFIVNEANNLELRNVTWVNDHNVLYIDNPVGTGFSFTENDAGYATNSNDVAMNLYVALQQFFDLFPELRKNEFYVTGESYAGKYIPALSYIIHKTNEHYNIENKINLAGLAIGNGMPDPINQLEYSDYLYQLGLVDANDREVLRTSLAQVKDLIKGERYIKAYYLLVMIFLGDKSGFQNLTGFKYHYNYLYHEEPKNYSWYESWLQQPNVRKTIHVGDQKFMPSSLKVTQSMIEDLLRSVVDVLEELLEHYRVLIYFGQLDIALPLSISRNYLQQLHWSGSEEYKKAARNQWFVENQLAGYTKCARNLTEVVIRNAGHMVSTDQPLWASAMIRKFTRHESLC